ncbi:hypothetical protein DKX38_002096 [Salix brachista]|uniref:SRP9 domain-containing protein n=1 Tax=Salix brachista TaxID=2182728 RepID=A0A5N5NNH7_9ROSI|nr:hypothetical protein DKX38_002096 [Salix brachista]
MRIVVSPRENGRNSKNSRHGRRVAKKVVVVLLACVAKVDGDAVVGRGPYEAVAAAEAIERRYWFALVVGLMGKIGEREKHKFYTTNMYVKLQRGYEVFRSAQVELLLHVGIQIETREWKFKGSREIMKCCKTRYVMKYRHCDGKLVLKVTDNKECLKFKTDQAQDAKKMEKLNSLFFTLMSRGPDVLVSDVFSLDAADLSEVTGKEQTEAQPGKKGRGRKQ